MSVTPPAGDVQGFRPTARTTALLTATGILVVGQMYVVLPLLAPMSSAFGLPVGDATWLATGFGAAYAAGFLLAGPLADRYGPRRVIVWGLLATSVTTAAVAAAGDLGSGVALRAVQGFTAASFAPAAFSYVTSRIAPERRPLVLTCVTSGFLAAAVVMQVSAQAVEVAAGWRAVFLVSGPLLALAALPAHRVLGADEPGRATSVRSAFAAMPRLLADPRLLALYGATATVLGGFVAVYTAVSVSGPPGIAGDPGALLWLRGSALPAMIAVPLLTPVLGRLPRHIRLSGGLGLASVAALAGSAVGGSVIALACVLLLLVGGVAISAPALVEAVGARGGANRGAAVALYACAMFIGASLGPQLVNVLHGWEFDAVVRVVAVVFAIGGVLGLAARQR